eukprot:2270079-Pleurochrysis_carterae.AAC.1
MATHGRGFPSTPDTDSEQGFRRAGRVATKARAHEAIRRSMHALRVAKRSRSGTLGERTSGLRACSSALPLAVTSAVVAASEAAGLRSATLSSGIGGRRDCGLART